MPGFLPDGSKLKLVTDQMNFYEHLIAIAVDQT
jgi:hypothetical protein